MHAHGLRAGGGFKLAENFYRPKHRPPDRRRRRPVAISSQLELPFEEKPARDPRPLFDVFPQAYARTDL